MDEESPVWWTLAAAFGGLGAGSVAGGLLQSRPGSSGTLTFADTGTLVFAISATMACIAWPEIRRSAVRSRGTLIDALTLATAAAVWGWSGFPPLTATLPSAATASVAGAGALLLPALTSTVAAPQLGRPRRWSALAIGGGAACLLLVEMLTSPELVVQGPWARAAWIPESAGFGLLAGAALAAAARAGRIESFKDSLAPPPFPIPAMIGILALVVGALALERSGPPMPLLLVAIGGCLAVREALRIVERRQSVERLSASLELEARLNSLQSDAGSSLAPKEALRRSCALASQVVRADAVLAWLVEDDALVLVAAAPERRERLVGRRLLLSDSDALAVRVFRRGEPEACLVAAPEARANRFLSTYLEADALLGVPIVQEMTPCGSLVLVREQGGSPFTPFDQQKAVLIAGQAAAALRRFELLGELESQLRETTLVPRFAEQAVAARTVNDVAWHLLESMRSQFAFDRGSVFLAEGGSRGALTPIAHFRSRNEGDIPFRQDDRLSEPIRYGGNPLGYVELHRAGNRTFGPAETRVVQALAQQAAVAIQNIRLRVESGKVSAYRELDRMKTELLNNVSHDLRGPLGNIKGHAQELLESAETMDPGEQESYLRTIEEEADRIKDLLEHLLDLSRLEAGAVRLELEPVNLARAVDRELGSIDRRRHSFENTVPWDALVMADSKRFRQVLRNLLENAVKYSPAGGAITVAAKDTQAEVLVSVSDQGVGIPRHQWDRIFRPYERAESGKAEIIAGTGLGLAICKGIIEAHGGRIWVESEPGVGSTFSFTVPRAPTLLGATSDASGARVGV